MDKKTGKRHVELNCDHISISVICSTKYQNTKYTGNAKY